MFQLRSSCMIIVLLLWHVMFIRFRVSGYLESFSGGAPVRSHPRLIGYNWCLIGRGRDKLVSERGFSQGIEPRLLYAVVGSCGKLVGSRFC